MRAAILHSSNTFSWRGALCVYLTLPYLTWQGYYWKTALKIEAARDLRGGAVMAV